MTRVSVIMPVYNARPYLSEAIESVLNQSFKDFEFVIIDDCSSDGSWDVIQEFASKDDRVKPFRNKENLGVVKSRNKGFRKAAETEYFAIFDSDDVCLPDRLQKQVRFLDENQEYGLVGGDIIVIDETGSEVGRRKYPKTHKEIRNNIIKFSPFAQPTAMIRKSVLEKVGHYNEDFERCQDYELWFRILKVAKAKNLRSVMIKYRISSTQGKAKHTNLTIKNTLKTH